MALRKHFTKVDPEPEEQVMLQTLYTTLNKLFNRKAGGDDSDDFEPGSSFNRKCTGKEANIEMHN